MIIDICLHVIIDICLLHFHNNVDIRRTSHHIMLVSHHITSHHTSITSHHIILVSHHIISYHASIMSHTSIISYHIISYLPACSFPLLSSSGLLVGTCPLPIGVFVGRQLRRSSRSRCSLDIAKKSLVDEIVPHTRHRWNADIRIRYIIHPHKKTLLCVRYVLLEENRRSH